MARGRKPKQDKENKTNVSPDTQTNKQTLQLSGETETVNNVTTTDKPKQVTKKTKDVVYMAVVRLKKGNQLHTTSIYKDKDVLMSRINKMNVVNKKIIEIDI